jgi:hypothetical protein
MIDYFGVVNPAAKRREPVAPFARPGSQAGRGAPMAARADLRERRIAPSGSIRRRTDAPCPRLVDLSLQPQPEQEPVAVEHVDALMLDKGVQIRVARAESE